MNSNRIKESIEKIEPAPDAQRRMYNNILKKAARPERTGVRRSIWLTAAPVAACLVVVLLVGLLPRETPAEQNRPAVPGQVMGGSPIVEVKGPEEFAPAGVMVTAPEGAAEVRYFLSNGEIAKLSFTMGGKEYICLASAVRTDDFSHVSGEQVSTQIIGEDPSITLYRIDKTIWKAEWISEELRAYLINYEGASEQEMRAVIGMLSISPVK